MEDSIYEKYLDNVQTLVKHKERFLYIKKHEEELNLLSFLESLNLFEISGARRY